MRSQHDRSCSLREIAEELGISQREAAVIERRALAKLRRLLRSKGQSRALREQLRALDAREREA